MFEALAIASAEDRQRDRQLVAAHLGRRGDLLGIHVDQLDHPVAVAATGGCLQVHPRRAGDAQRFGQRFGDEGQHVRPAIDETLVLDQPRRPHVAIAETHRARRERHRLGGIGNVFLESALAGRRRLERELAARAQVQRPGGGATPLGAAARPVRQAVPAVLAGVVDQHRRRIRLRRAFDQVLIEERLEHVAAELQRGIAVELQRAQVACLVVDLAVPPRSHHQIIQVVAGIASFHRLVAVVRAPHVFLVPQALQPHGRDLQWCAGHLPIQCLLLPERVIGGMLGHLVPPRNLFQSMGPGIVAGRTGTQEGGVVVQPLAGHRSSLAALGQLAGEVAEIDLPERTVVEPVVAHPAIDHRALRRRHLERRMRIGQRHHHGEAFIGRAEHADASVGLGHVLDQPVDGVPGVGGVIDLGRIQRPAQRTGHHVIAL